jgi:hypothetical protein
VRRSRDHQSTSVFSAKMVTWPVRSPLPIVCGTGPRKLPHKSLREGAKPWPYSCEAFVPNQVLHVSVRDVDLSSRLRSRRYRSPENSLVGWGFCASYLVRSSVLRFGRYTSMWGRRPHEVGDGAVQIAYGKGCFFQLTRRHFNDKAEPICRGRLG